MISFGSFSKVWPFGQRVTRASGAINNSTLQPVGTQSGALRQTAPSANAPAGGTSGYQYNPAVTPFNANGANLHAVNLSGSTASGQPTFHG